MNGLKTWQAVTLAVIAVAIAVGVIWHYASLSAQGAPVPPAYSGPPAANAAQPGAGASKQGSIPMPPGSFPGAPPAAGANTQK